MWIGEHMGKLGADAFWAQFPDVKHVVLQGFVPCNAPTWQGIPDCDPRYKASWQLLETLPPHITALEIAASSIYSDPLEDCERLRGSFRRLARLEELAINNMNCVHARPGTRLDVSKTLTMSADFLPSTLKSLSVLTRWHGNSFDRIVLDEDRPLVGLERLVVSAAMTPGLDTWVQLSRDTLQDLCVLANGRPSEINLPSLYTATYPSMKVLQIEHNPVRYKVPDEHLFRFPLLESVAYADYEDFFPKA